MSVRGASSHNSAETKYGMLVSSMTIIAHNSLCSTRAYHLRIDLALMPLLGNVVFQKFTYDHARSIYQMHSNEGESVSTYPCRPKAEASSDAVDVVELLRDSTDQAPNIRHLRVQHTFSLITSHELLIQLSFTGEFRQHDGVVTDMMYLPAQGFA